ncbi:MULTISPECIES: iron-sulfur cluster assembly scaffold protein [Novosphingobium]|uniref:iron-sulfur cluster assembly scaffold protein n=1 Tax=Novosphingobium TaxID=165696 RepID=UPI001CD1A246|nr:iron-sulfur cluster assembly scaffold protein [Novosphingobium percolationis]MCH7628720.1 iron-sulfur cluster assembly scaffold protein [Pseudomonadota bacterium]
MAQALYTPAILAAATGLAAFPWDEALALRGEARSRSCGSSIALGMATDEAGRIARIGMKPHACAVGQAAAHVFASAAAGRTIDEIATTRAALAAWLAGADDAPDWPGVDLLAPARAYPGRHAAILLAWDAAIAALS